MTTITGLSPLATASAAPEAGRDWSSLGQEDFFRLLTVQMQQQDPFEPVDNKEMLAQIAQFSSLAAVSDTNTALEDISRKLDALVAAQGSTIPQEN